MPGRAEGQDRRRAGAVVAGEEAAVNRERAVRGDGGGDAAADVVEEGAVGDLVGAEQFLTFSNKDNENLRFVPLHPRPQVLIYIYINK